MVHWLTALVLSVDLGLVPSTYMYFTAISYLTSRESDVSSHLLGHLACSACGAYTYMWAKYSHIK